VALDPGFADNGLVYLSYSEPGEDGAGTAVARGKLKYRPVVFELLPPEFTLYDLQKTVEAISGTLLHKQNFRRLVEKGGLVEATGNVSTETGGRPARLYRFRREVVLERPAPGLRVKAGRAQV